MLKDVKQTYWKLSAFCIGSSLPLTIFGPGIMGFFIVFGIFFGFIATKGNSLRSSVAFVRTSKVSWLILTLLLIFFISALLSIDVVESMRKISELLGISLLALSLYIVLREMPLRHVDLTYQSLAVSTIVISLLALLDALLGDVRLSSALHGVQRAEDPDRLIHMSSVFAVLSPFLWAWLLRLSKEGVVLAQWLALPASVLSILSIFVSGGYMGWIALCCALLIFIVIAVREHRFEINIKGIFTASLTLFVGPVMYLYTQGVLFTKDFGLSYLKLDIIQFVSVRWALWMDALSYLDDKILFGYGLNTYKLLPWDNPKALPAAYNIFVQLLLETGLIGTLACGFIFYLILRYFLEASSKSLYALAGLTSILAFIIAALGNTSIFHPWWLTMIIFSGIFSARVGWVINNKRV